MEEFKINPNLLEYLNKNKIKLDFESPYIRKKHFKDENFAFMSTATTFQMHKSPQVTGKDKAGNFTTKSIRIRKVTKTEDVQPSEPPRKAFRVKEKKAAAPLPVKKTSPPKRQRPSTALVTKKT